MPDALDKPTIDVPPPIAPEREGQLTDVFAPKWRLLDHFGGLSGLLSTLPFFFVVAVTLNWASEDNRGWATSGALVLLFAGPFVIYKIERRRIREYARRRARLDANSFFLGFFRRHRGARLSPAPTHDLIHELGRAGFVGDTVRIVHTRSYRPIMPLRVEFEPRLISETDRSFGDLETAATTSDPRTPCARRARQRHRRGAIHRAFVLFGGWRALLLLLFAAAIALLSTIATGDESYFYAAAITLITMCLVFVWAAIRRSVHQWLLVPGGLAVRRSGWFSSNWRVKMFGRQNSVLVARELHRETRWLVTVADTRVTESMQFTRPEVDLLLAAWLSPVPPPPVERLSDLEH